MIKRLLARAAGLEDLFGDQPFSRDRNWASKAPHAYFLTAVEARRRFPDLLLFSFVREPLSRLASCYRSKIVRPEVMHASLLREGLVKQTTFPQFVRHVCRRQDWRSNIHYRSQAHILRGPGGLAPDFIGRVEQMEQDWRRLSGLQNERGNAPLPLLPRRRASVREDQMKSGDLFAGDEDLMDQARRRYAADIALFYSDVSLASLEG